MRRGVAEELAGLGDVDHSRTCGKCSISSARSSSNSSFKVVRSATATARIAKNEFASIEDAKQKIELWRQDYNQHGPHSSLGHLTPNEFAMQGRETALETARL